MSEDDLERVLEARTRAALRRRERIIRTFFFDRPRVADCHRDCDEFFEICQEHVTQENDINLVLFSLEDRRETFRTVPTPCQRCRNAMATRDEEEAAFIWEKLPADLGLSVEGWDASLPSTSQL